MMTTTTRLLLIIALAVMVHLCFLVVQKHGMPTEIRLPAGNLADMPMTFGPWNGKESKLDPRLVGGIGAAAVVNREYQDDAGHVVSLHSSVVTKFDVSLQHHPKHCYIANGSDVVLDKRGELEFADLPNVPVAIMVAEQGGQRLLVLYWYQLGEKFILNGREQRTVRWDFRGQKTWPPLIKVLLSAPASDLVEDEKRLMEFAKLVYLWTKDLDRQPTTDTSPQEPLPQG